MNFWISGNSIIVIFSLLCFSFSCLRNIRAHQKCIRSWTSDDYFIGMRIIKKKIETKNNHVRSRALALIDNRFNVEYQKSKQFPRLINNHIFPLGAETNQQPQMVNRESSELWLLFSRIDFVYFVIFATSFRFAPYASFIRKYDIEFAVIINWR